MKGACTTCRDYPAKYNCDGCDVAEVWDGGGYCGYCARPVWVVWIGHVMKQRLCPICRTDGLENWIFDARHFTKEHVKAIMGLSRMGEGRG